MSTKETRPQEPKIRTVPLKDVIYWVIIAIVAVSGVITGWTLRSDMNAKVDAEVTRQFEKVSKIQK